MSDKTKRTPEDSSETKQAAGDCQSGSCATLSCGGPGLCPGVALVLAYVLGVGITMLTGLTWLGWTIGIPVALILITGAWRFLPQANKGKAE